MKSTKILTINPFPSGVNQKLVPAKKYNELWDDVYTLEKQLFASDFGYTKALSFSVLNGLSVSSANPGESVFVSARDFITGTHYTGNERLYYAIKLAADGPPTVDDWKDDPRAAFVTALSGSGANVTNVYIRPGLGGEVNMAGTYFLA